MMGPARPRWELNKPYTKNTVQNRNSRSNCTFSMGSFTTLQPIFLPFFISLFFAPLLLLPFMSGQAIYSTRLCIVLNQSLSVLLCHFLSDHDHSFAFFVEISWDRDIFRRSLEFSASPAIISLPIWDHFYWSHYFGMLNNYPVTPRPEDHPPLCAMTTYPSKDHCSCRVEHCQVLGNFHRRCLFTIRLPLLLCRALSRSWYGLANICRNVYGWGKTNFKLRVVQSTYTLPIRMICKLLTYPLFYCQCRTFCRTRSDRHDHDCRWNRIITGSTSG